MWRYRAKPLWQRLNIGPVKTLTNPQPLRHVRFTNIGAPLVVTVEAIDLQLLLLLLVVN